jgi:hypothetical protein
MLRQLLRALKKPAPAPAQPTELPRGYPELARLAQARDASPALLMACAQAAFEQETAAGDAQCKQALERLLAREPTHALAHYVLSLLCMADADFAGAEQHLAVSRAVEDNGYVLYTLIQALLQQGKYHEGYEAFSIWRNSITNRHAAPSIAALPAWRGEPLTGKRLVLWTDWGGFGDDIAYLRFARTIHETLRPARLVVAARAPLLRLLAQQPYVDEAVGLEALVSADFQCPLIEAPRVLGTQSYALPAWPAYVHAPQADIAKWRERLRGEQRLKVGLVWTSTSVNSPGARKISRFDKQLEEEDVRKLAGIEGVAYVSLQVGAGIARAGDVLPAAEVLDYTAELRDFADTAALLAALDVVLTVDTGVAHLAGALGVPTLLLLRKSLAVFYPAGRTGTPWYPSAYMLVQREQRDWAPVIAAARAALARRAAGAPWPQCCGPGQA